MTMDDFYSNQQAYKYCFFLMLHSAFWHLKKNDLSFSRKFCHIDITGDVMSRHKYWMNINLIDNTSYKTLEFNLIPGFLNN